MVNEFKQPATVMDSLVCYRIPAHAKKVIFSLTSSVPWEGFREFWGQKSYVQIANLTQAVLLFPQLHPLSVQLFPWAWPLQFCSFKAETWFLEDWDEVTGAAQLLQQHLSNSACLSSSSCLWFSLRVTVLVTWSYRPDEKSSEVSLQVMCQLKLLSNVIV